MNRADARMDEVVDQLAENAKGASLVDHSMLAHKIHLHNIEYFRTAMLEARATVKRAVWRMAQRRSYESLARWAADHAVDGVLSLETLTAELSRRSTKLDETETEDEQKERSALDREIADDERRTAPVLLPRKAGRIQELSTTRGMGRR